MRRPLLASCALLAIACTDGPGRTPIFPDAEAPYDAGFRDADPGPDAIADAGPPDSAVVLFDSGIPPREFPFTGQWQIQGDQNRVYAREVQGRLSIIVGGPPYVYTGTIDREGNVDVVSHRLARSGCQVPRITGSFQRLSASIFLTHQSCGAMGPFTSPLNGSFEVDYTPGLSGIYRVVGQIMNDPVGCHQGSLGPLEMVWGVSTGPGSNVIALYTAHDIVAEHAVYIGRIETPDYTFAATDGLYAQPSGADMSMRGSFVIGGVNDPARVVGTRNVYDAARQCNFGIAFEGIKIADY